MKLLKMYRIMFEDIVFKTHSAKTTKLSVKMVDVFRISSCLSLFGILGYNSTKLKVHKVIPQISKFINIFLRNGLCPLEKNFCFCDNGYK